MQRTIQSCYSVLIDICNNHQLENILSTLCKANFSGQKMEISGRLLGFDAYVLNSKIMLEDKLVDAIGNSSFAALTPEGNIATGIQRDVKTLSEIKNFEILQSTLFIIEFPEENQQLVSIGLSIKIKSIIDESQPITYTLDGSQQVTFDSFNKSLGLYGRSTLYSIATRLKLPVPELDEESITR